MGRLTVPRRVARFFSVVRAKSLSANEVALVRRWLNDDALPLFMRMEAADQRHCLQVFEVLRRDGWEDPDLLSAALLHDCGKGGASLSVWHRVIIDVVGQRSVRLLRWLARRGPRWLAEPLKAGLDHDEIGANAAASAGCSERTVALIRGARGDSLASEAMALRIADGAR
jgi:hypothetical protein